MSVILSLRPSMKVWSAWAKTWFVSSAQEAKYLSTCLWCCYCCHVRPAHLGSKPYSCEVPVVASSFIIPAAFNVIFYN
jgi:hypothetical protein